ncbi:MAG: hypothetical protein Q8K78_13925 [Planctomycetaceae bacterium]|nr:hypothetical protein [Planctomycetaceae bacterium]
MRKSVPMACVSVLLFASIVLAAPMWTGTYSFIINGGTDGFTSPYSYSGVSNIDVKVVSTYTGSDPASNRILGTLYRSNGFGGWVSCGGAYFSSSRTTSIRWSNLPKGYYYRVNLKLEKYTRYSAKGTVSLSGSN